jgi:protein-arginine kinase activator protein McsA
MDTILDQLDQPDKPVESGTSCPVCGMSKDQLVVAGSLGCPFCVQTFRHQFLLARKRRGLPAGYAGKVPLSLAASPGSFPGGQGRGAQPESSPAASLLPCSALEGSRLLADMESAVLAEDFEKAAMLRDRLGSAKNNGYTGNDA